MDSAEEDSADTIKGYDPEAEKWVVAKRTKSNKPSKVRRRKVEPEDTESRKVQCGSEGSSEDKNATQMENEEMGVHAEYESGDEEDEVFLEGGLCSGGQNRRCGRKIMRKDIGIRCEICCKWYHTRCQNLSPAAYSALQEHTELTWICDNCKELKTDKKTTRMYDKFDHILAELREQTTRLKETVIRNVSENMAGIEHRILSKIKEEAALARTDQMERMKDLEAIDEKNKQEIMNMHELLEGVKESVEIMGDKQGEGSSLRQAARTIAEKTATYVQVAKSAEEQMQKICSKMQENTASTDIDTKLIKEQQEVLKKFVQMQEKGDRAMNVIMHNVEESSSKDIGDRIKHDTAEVMKVAEALGIEDMGIVKVIRLNRKRQPGQAKNESKKPRMLLVRLKTEEEAERLYNRRYNLRQYSDFDNVFISRDLCPEQRREQRKFREELKEKGTDGYKIFRGRVVARHSQQ